MTGSVATLRELSASFRLPQRLTAGLQPQKHTRQWPPEAGTVDTDVERSLTDATQFLNTLKDQTAVLCLWNYIHTHRILIYEVTSKLVSLETSSKWKAHFQI